MTTTTGARDAAQPGGRGLFTVGEERPVTAHALACFRGPVTCLLGTLPAGPHRRPGVLRSLPGRAPGPGGARALMFAPPRQPGTARYRRRKR
ncbi:hypothetical protein [Streptomyces syringium]|uniref:hypothetical protein n=1 Tax=Streptomyces syringium TaxID=76729 RepID=UPI0033CD84BA